MEFLPVDLPAFLVGGAVRDALVGREIHDLDIILKGSVIRATRSLADKIGAAFYPLDVQRDYARLILKDDQGERLVLDFTPQDGPDLESDLRKRDFTFNAIALDLRQPHKLYDPLGGIADLLAKKLRACSATAFLDDPVRVLRAVRQSVSFSLQILPESLALIRQAVPRLPQVSPERLRDELFKMLSQKRPAAAFNILDMLGGLPYILPEINALKGIEQSPPHINDVWNHTLEVLNRLEDVLQVLATDYDPDKAASLILGMSVLRLGRYRQQLEEHLSQPLNPDRSMRSLLFLAALYHDTGKPQTRQVDINGRIRFFDHGQVGASLMSRRAQTLRLSNQETERLVLIVKHHMHPLLLAYEEQLPTRKAIYRFFRQTGEAGVDVCILSLADMLATYGSGLPPEMWAHQLDVVRMLLESWWEKPAEAVSPPPLINGHDLMDRFGLEPGPQLGDLLEAIREAQATGQVATLEDAFTLAGDLINKNDDPGGKTT